jgi:hypothetical protein
MSELVNKIHSLKKTIIGLREEVASERARYVDEVDHSEQLAFCLASIMSGATGDVGVTAELTLKEHHARRVADELLLPLLPLDND